MDSNSFDALARLLSAGRSRRGLGLLLGGLAAGGMLAPLLAPVDLAAKKKKKRKKRKKGGQAPPPVLPPPPPPLPPSCATTGCPYFEVCQAGTCVNCLGDPCSNAGQCCTNHCTGSGCGCIVGNFACTSNAQCCNGSCNLETQKCTCDPAGSPCNEVIPSCCGTCSAAGVCQ
jgi:hypothetical protein